MKRILALAFAAAMTIALVPTDVDARGGRGGGGGMGGGGFGGMGGGGIGGMGGGGNWRPGYGWGAAAAGAALGAGYWGSGYDPYAYASEGDSCQQQRTVWRNGAYRTVWVNVC
jgi:hypothetical protein